MDWESRIVLFAALLIEEGKKSTTVRSYISAIKAVLLDNNIAIHEDTYLLNALTKACKMRYDRVNIRLLIRKTVLNILLKTTEQHFVHINQPYLVTLYLAMFTTAYYGLLRIGEITDSQHVVKTWNMHIGLNKQKLQFILWSSKTHSKGVHPQTIKIASTRTMAQVEHSQAKPNKSASYCPYSILKDFLQAQNGAVYDGENFFVFSDHQPVKDYHFRNTLKNMLKLAGFDAQVYTRHGFRAGRSVDLLSYGLSVETIKKLGHWRSNAVYAYFK